MSLRVSSVPYADKLAQRPIWGVALHDYGGGLVEATARLMGLKSRPSRGRRTLRGHGHRAANAQRAARRARAKVRRYVLAGGFDHLLTLTFRGAKTDLDWCWRQFYRFVRLYRRRYCPDFQYIVAWERHKSGGIHFHLAVKGFHPAQVLRACWWDVVGRAQGNVDIQYRRAVSRLFIARYLTKYVTKAFEDSTVLNAKRYDCSRGIKIPTELIRVVDMRDVLELVRQRAGHVRTVWQPDDGGAVLWCASW